MNKIEEYKSKIDAINKSISEGSDLDAETIKMMASGRDRLQKKLDDLLAAEPKDEPAQNTNAQTLGTEEESEQVNEDAGMANLSAEEKKEVQQIKEDMQTFRDILDDDSLPEEDRAAFQQNYDDLEQRLKVLMSSVIEPEKKQKEKPTEPTEVEKAEDQEGVKAKVEEPAAQPATVKDKGKKKEHTSAKKEQKPTAGSAMRSRGRPSLYPEPKYMTDAEIHETANSLAASLKDTAPIEVVLTLNEISKYKERENENQHVENLLFLAKKTKNKDLIGIAKFIERAQEKQGEEDEVLYALHSALSRVLKYKQGKSTRGRKQKGDKASNDAIKEEVAKQENVKKEDIILVDGVPYNMEDCEEAIRAFYAKKEQHARASAAYQVKGAAEKAEHNFETAFKHVFKAFDKEAIESNPKGFKDALKEAKKHFTDFVNSFSRFFESKASAKEIKDALDELQRQFDVLMDKIS